MTSPWSTLTPRPTPSTPTWTPPSGNSRAAQMNCESHTKCESHIRRGFHDFLLQLQWPGQEARQGGDGLQHAPGARVDDLPGPADGRLQLRGQVGAGGRGPAGARRQGRHLHPREAGQVLASSEGSLASVQGSGVRQTFPAHLRPGKLRPSKRQTTWQHTQVSS